MDEQLLTVQEAAEYLRVGEETVRRYIRSGKLEAIKVGRGYRITREAIDDFLRQLREGKA